MTKDEALRLALEAMEKITKQMLALRDELAERGSRPKNNLVHQKLWDSSYDVYANCAIPTAEDILDALEAKVEPVAWMYPDDLKRFETSEAYAQAYSIEMVSPTQGETIPLYTTPPQRKPLTDEELLRLLSKIDECTVRLPRGLREFARAIEAVHGITGENT